MTDHPTEETCPQCDGAGVVESAGGLPGAGAAARKGRVTCPQCGGRGTVRADSKEREAASSEVETGPELVGDPEKSVEAAVATQLDSEADSLAREAAMLAGSHADRAEIAADRAEAAAELAAAITATTEAAATPDQPTPAIERMKDRDAPNPTPDQPTPDAAAPAPERFRAGDTPPAAGDIPTNPPAAPAETDRDAGEGRA